MVRATLALLLAAIAAFASVRSVSANEEHIVRPGETLSQIAARYGTTVARLRQLNNLPNANFVWYGQRLLIDGPTPNFSTHANQNRGGVATYRVRTGDSLSKIARRYGISLTEFARMNNLSPFRWLYTGQVLRVPDSAPSGQAFQGQSSPAGATNQNASGIQFYTVLAGDSLSRIARRYGISLSELARMNNLSPNRWLYTGQVLRVPGPAPEQPATPLPAPDVQAAPPQAEVNLARTQVVAHLVQPGELLSHIADRYGVPAAVLARINRLQNTNVLEVGQVLRIPPPNALELLEGSFARLHPSQYPTQTERWIEVDLSEQLAVAYEGTIPDQGLCHIQRGRQYADCDGHVPHLGQDCDAGHERRESGLGQLLSSERCPECAVFLQKLRLPRHLLAQQLRLAHEQRLRQFDRRRRGVAVRLDFARRSQ